MKTILMIVCLVLGGCSPVWIERTVPTTNAEREAIAKHVEAVLAATPKSLAGHDQDWDDAVNAAHFRAAETFCRKTYWEYAAGGRCTGRWRYAEQVKTSEVVGGNGVGSQRTQSADTEDGRGRSKTTESLTTDCTDTNLGKFNH